MIGEKTTFRQQLEKLQRAGEEKRLKALQAKYPNPNNIDYGNMSLRNELQTRFDLNEMNNLSAKLGTSNGFTVGNDNSAPVQDLSQRLSGNDKGTQNGFYAALGKPTPNYIPKSHILEIAGAGLQGFGKGIESGMLTAVNGATNDYYNKLSSKYLGDYYNKNQRQIQRQAEAAGLGQANQIANDVIEYGASAWADTKTAGLLSSNLFNQPWATNWLKKLK